MTEFPTTIHISFRSPAKVSAFRTNTGSLGQHCAARFSIKVDELTKRSSRTSGGTANKSEPNCRRGN